MKDNSKLIDIGVSFIVSVLSYLMVGPVIYALLFPYIKGDLMTYASLFIPSVFTLIVLILIKRKRFFEDFVLLRNKKFSSSLFLIFTLSSFVFLSIASLLEGATLNTAPAKAKIISLLVSLLFIPIQITIEEYIFRVLPLRVLDNDSLGKKSWCILISIASGILFTLPHLFNKEVWVEGGKWAIVHYFLWGVLVMGGAIVTKGFEFPLSMHLSNNLVVSIVANYKGSSLPSISFFILENETSSPKAIITFLLLFAFELLVFCAYKRRRHSES